MLTLARDDHYVKEWDEVTVRGEGEVRQAMESLVLGDRYYTPVEAAKILKLSLRTVHSLLRAKKMVSIRVGNQWRIPASSLQESTTEGVDGDVGAT